VQASPAGATERAIGTGAEFAGAALASGGGVIPALASGAGAAFGEAAGGDTGKLIGAIAAPIGTKAVTALTKMLIVRPISDVINMLSEKGLKRILTRYQAGIIGEEHLDDVINRLRNAPTHVPGAPPTAGHAVADLPAGSPIVAHQKIIAATSRGESARFGERELARRAAVQTAREAAGPETEPLRQAAMKGARASGGVKAENIIDRIDVIMARPGKRSSDVVRKTLEGIKQKIADLSDVNGRIDPEALHTIRKEIGNDIQKFAKETANWDKRLTSGLETSIQKRIDFAITAAGGTGWKDYIREFAGKMKNIRAEKQRAIDYARPVQRTELGGGIRMAEEQRLHIPQLLSRPALAANFVLKKLGQGVEPKLDKIAAERYLDPQKLADALESVRPSERAKVIKNLMSRGYIIGPAGAATASSLENEAQ